MALDFAALQAEFQARGFSDMTSAGDLVRLKRWLVDAMHMIDEMEDWAYLNTSTTGTAPLTIADLRKVESVSDVAGQIPLNQRSRGEMAHSYVDLTIAGQPYEFYVTGGTTINVYPANTTRTLTVTYWKFGPDLSAGTDVPLMPDRFRMAIVEYAVDRAATDRGAYDQAQAAQQAGDAIVDRMRQWSGMIEPGYTFVPMIGEDC